MIDELIIDAHVHVWRLADWQGHGFVHKIGALERDFTRDQLFGHCKAGQIDQAILVQAAANKAETHRLLTSSRDDPFIAGVIGWVDLETDLDKLDATLDELQQYHKLIGIRAMPPQTFGASWLQDNKVRAGFRRLNERGLVIDLLVSCHELNLVRDLLDAVPDLRVVLNHGGRPLVMTKILQPWAQEIAELASNSRIFCKLSGLIERAGVEWTPATLEPWISALIDTFGCRRLMFASNWPVLETMGTYSGWWDALINTIEALGVSDIERSALLGGTARRAYALDAKNR